ncbi:MAG: PD-(D/E)XK nuclease family protein [Candidatus Omnitrophota bacterium]
MDKAKEIIDKVARGIRAGDFSARPRYRSCAYCAYNHICPQKS